MQVIAKPMDYRAFDFHATLIDRNDPTLFSNRYAACGNDLALFMNYLRTAGVITAGQFDQALDYSQDQGWSQCYIMGAGLPPSTVVANVDFVWLVEATPYKRSFSVASPSLQPSAADLAPASKAILAAAPPVMVEQVGSSFTERLSEVVNSVQTVSGNLGVPFLPQIAGAVKGVLGLFSKRRSSK